MERDDFHRTCFSRDGNSCVVPWCERELSEAHHIISRSRWKAEHNGYIPKNGASVCTLHHKYAERGAIPPCGFWYWISDEDWTGKPVVPEGLDSDIDKHGNPLDSPRYEDRKKFYKYQSTSHLMPLYWHSESIADSRIERDDSGLKSVDSFVNIPLVATVKMDGSNSMLVKDRDNPVRARNGSQANHKSFSMLKRIYHEKNLYAKIPEHLQIFGEWMYAKHSIHYGCDECCKDRNQGPKLKNGLFQVFGVFNTELNMWLSWPDTERVAKHLGLNTVPVVYLDEKDDDIIDREDEFRRTFIEIAQNVVNEGHEGIVIRSKFPFHYSHFDRRLGKYVRENHVEENDEHWSKKKMTRNKTENETLSL